MTPTLSRQTGSTTICRWCGRGVYREGPEGRETGGMLWTFHIATLMVICGEKSRRGMDYLSQARAAELE